jgi:hypothetical protein
MISPAAATADVALNNVFQGLAIVPLPVASLPDGLMYQVVAFTSAAKPKQNNKVKKEKNTDTDFLIEK